MSVNIKSQKDVLVTEATLESDADLNQWDEIMRATKSTGKIVATYNQGGRLGVSIEQRTRIAQKVASDVRSLTGVSTREM